MKKRMLSLVLLLTIGLSSVFASDAEGVNKQVLNSFKKDFSDATAVSWQASKDFVKVTFTMNNQVMFAWYSADEAKLLGVIRNIVSSQLPIRLMADLKKNYSDFWITDLFEMAARNSTTYYVTLENADGTVILESNGSDSWTVYKKEKKNIDQ